MFKVLGLISLSTQSLSQSVKGDITPVYDYPIGGDNDANGCLISAGYSWCEANSECIRSWITPCADNFNGCPDCLSKQQRGMNIACPTDCNLIIDQLPEPQIQVPSLYPSIHPHPVDPIPLHPVDTPPCPEVMCMMYCENGFALDDNGCDTCSCLGQLVTDPIPDNPPILSGIHRDVCSPLQKAVSNRCNSDCHNCDLSNTQIILDGCMSDDGTLATDTLCNDYQSGCPIPYSDCDSQYVCPKVTEITQCSDGGISGYTTYQLSLVIKNPIVKDIYAMYGGTDPTLRPMSFPPAYQGDNIFNNNLGGIPSELIAINNDANYDSWLTIGLTNGDPMNKLSTIGIDFNSWTEQQGIYTTNGAVFVMDPGEVITTENEYIIAQLTIPTGTSVTATVNIQGKTTNSLTWTQDMIEFIITPPVPVNTNVIPQNCISWYDGCNTCQVNNGILGACTKIMCFREDDPHCLSFDIPNGH